MSEVRLSTEPRTDFGKGAARRVRRASRVPAVVYGHGTEPQHLTLPGHETALALVKGTNVLLRLDSGDGEQVVMPKEVQRDPIRGFLEHVDLVVIRQGETVTVDVPVTLVGESGADVVATQGLNTLSVSAPATDMPQGFEVDVEGLAVGESVTAGQVPLGEGVTLLTDAEEVVVSVQSATAEETEADLETAEAELGAGDTGATEQDAAQAEVGDGVTDGETGTGDVVPGADEQSGGPADAA